MRNKGDYKSWAVYLDKQHGVLPLGQLWWLLDYRGVQKGQKSTKREHFWSFLDFLTPCFDAETIQMF